MLLSFKILWNSYRLTISFFVDNPISIMIGNCENNISFVFDCRKRKIHYIFLCLQLLHWNDSLYSQIEIKIRSQNVIHFHGLFSSVFLRMNFQDIDDIILFCL
jgi:hypothetical protein